MDNAGERGPGSVFVRPGVVLLALAAVFLVAHVAILPTSFADLDEINFAMGVRDFDIAKHQPHPPGYPVFIAMAKVSTAVAGALGIGGYVVRGLAILSAISGALLIPILFYFARALFCEPTGQRLDPACSTDASSRSVSWVPALWIAVVAACSPLIWFNALRPLSDLTGLAAAVAAQALLIPAILAPPGRRTARLLVSGAAVAGLAIGIRSQAFVLTLPLLAVALVRPRPDVCWRARTSAIAAFSLAVAAWAIPLLLVSGGLDGYLAALGDQAGEDFSGVVMLWTMRTARVAIDAIEYSFLWPWGSIPAGWIVIGVASLGAVRMLVRAPAVFGVLMLAFAPYAIFHLLFHETFTTRYAAPLVIPVVVLAVYGLLAIGRLALHLGAAALVAWSLATTLPSAAEYATSTAPAAEAIRVASEATVGEAVLSMHAVFKRTEEWYGSGTIPVIRQRHGREIPALVERWLAFPNTRVTFIADPRRSDLAMLDPRSRRLVSSYEWGFPELPLLGGVRPGEAQLLVLTPPGWMLDTGWALTAEIGGQTERAGAGPARRPAIAWVRSRPDAAVLMIGGRNLEPSGGPAARVSITVAGRPLDSFVVPPGYFFETRTLPAGILEGSDAYIPLAVTAQSLDSRAVRVSLEQFDLQSGDVPMVGLENGWHEPEYDPILGWSWRWMSNDATLWIHPRGRDITLKLSGESPLKYFDDPPSVVISVDSLTVAEFAPATDFTREVHLPAALLAAGNGRVQIRSSQSFVPGNGDARTLALRVFSVDVN